MGQGRFISGSKTNAESRRTKKDIRVDIRRNAKETYFQGRQSDKNLDSLLREGGETSIGIQICIQSDSVLTFVQV